MKRILALILILTLAVAPALAEFADLSLEELQAKATAIQMEILARAGEGFTLYPGIYIVGEDIPAGKYRIEVAKAHGIIKIDNVNGRRYLSEFLSLADEDDNAVIGKAILEVGMTVEIESTTFIFKPYMGIMP